MVIYWQMLSTEGFQKAESAKKMLKAATRENEFFSVFCCHDSPRFFPPSFATTLTIASFIDFRVAATSTCDFALG